jgi:hypothetical protein
LSEAVLVLQKSAEKRVQVKKGATGNVVVTMGSGKQALGPVVGEG